MYSYIHMYICITYILYMHIYPCPSEPLQAGRSVMPVILENTYFSEDFETPYNKGDSASDDTSDIIIKIKIIPLKMKSMKILVSHGDCVHTLPPHSILLGEDLCER